MKIEKKSFGTLDDGRVANIFTVSNKNGMSVKVSDYGATLVGVIAPDKNGKLQDVVLGFESANDYDKAEGYLGAVVGRVAGRIGDGRFTLDGATYELSKNDKGVCHLHGGDSGFDAKIWNVDSIDEEENAITFSLVSPDGDEGYPGTLTVKVTYKLNNKNQLAISYEATTDKKTIVNLTNHAYFNLSGNAENTVYDHIVCIDAGSYLRSGEDLVANGEIIPVDGTPLDFRAPKEIGKDIKAKHRDIDLGFDHTYVFSKTVSDKPTLRAMVKHPETGRTLKVYTDQPCMQLYTGNFLEDVVPLLKGGVSAKIHTALCLETQKMPNSINHDHFTDVRLDVGEKYIHTTVYEFGVE